MLGQWDEKEFGEGMSIFIQLFNKLLRTCLLLMFMWGFPFSVHRTDVCPQPGSSMGRDGCLLSLVGGCLELPSFSLRVNGALASHVYRNGPA